MKIKGTETVSYVWFYRKNGKHYRDIGYRAGAITEIRLAGEWVNIKKVSFV